MIGPIRGQCPAITWWQEVSRRLLSNVVRPDMTLYTGNWHQGTFSNQTPRRISIRGDKEEGCVVWYFGTESLTLAGWLLATLHGNAKFAYFQNHWVGSCVQGQLSSARNMWSHTSSSWLPSQKNVSIFLYHMNQYYILHLDQICVQGKIVKYVFVEIYVETPKREILC